MCERDAVTCYTGRIMHCRAPGHRHSLPSAITSGSIQRDVRLHLQIVSGGG